MSAANSICNILLSFPQQKYFTLHGEGGRHAVLADPGHLSLKRRNVASFFSGLLWQFHPPPPGNSGSTGQI